jgi:hypothetical protein
VTEPADIPLLREVVRFQLALVDTYAALLESSAWDEARLNTAVKSFLASVLALVRVQHAVGGRFVASQHEMLREYRQRLLDWLAANDDTAATAPPPGTAR